MQPENNISEVGNVRIHQLIFWQRSQNEAVLSLEAVDRMVKTAVNEAMAETAFQLILYVILLLFEHLVLLELRVTTPAGKPVSFCVVWVKFKTRQKCRRF